MSVVEHQKFKRARFAIIELFVLGITITNIYQHAPGLFVSWGRVLDLISSLRKKIQSTDSRSIETRFPQVTSILGFKYYSYF